MTTLNNLPKQFKPYSSLKICSNTLYNGGHLASIGDNLPLIIGKGEIPLIWLQALNDIDNKIFIPIIEKSISKNPNVVISKSSQALSISILGQQILSLKVINQDSAEVDFLDLRPIGLNLYGDKQTLNIGTNKFSGNSMSGGGVLIGLGN